MPERYDLSGQELEIMNLLWKTDREMTLGEIADLLSKQGFLPTIGTIKTYLSRLVKKGALKTRKEGHKLIYRPSMSESGYAQRWTENFLKESFDGSLVSFVSTLTGNQELSEKERKILKDLYNE